jgi:predicted esterase
MTPDEVMALFEERIETLILSAPNALVERHLDSTLRVVQRAFDNLPLETPAHPDRADIFVDIVSMILDRLPEEQFDWDDHVRRALPLCFAFISDFDHTLQFYALQLPYAWDPDEIYPLVVFLHGAGAHHPLKAGLATVFDNSHQDTLFTYDVIESGAVPPSHRAFVLAPWARGNSGYCDGGEANVWESLALVQSEFNTDPERTYLTGFSMGCSGAWKLAARTPSLWAGVNVAGGFGPWSQTTIDYLIENMHGVPVSIWIGENDGMIGGAHEFHEKLVAAGFDVKAAFIPGLGHTYPYTEYQSCLAHLMQYTRPHPDSFTFLADTQAHPGRDGVTMRVPQFPHPDRLPRFECSVDGQTVSIVSENTTGLRVELGEGGLSLTGEVTLTWNGEQVYTGPAERVDLGDGTARRMRRAR